MEVDTVAEVEVVAEAMGSSSSCSGSLDPSVSAGVAGDGDSERSGLSEIRDRGGLDGKLGLGSLGG